MKVKNCLLASLIAFFSNREIRIFYDADHVIYKKDGKFYDQDGPYRKSTDKFLPIEKYGAAHITNSFELSPQIDQLWKLYLKTVKNES